MSWRDRAACRGKGPDLFFPPPTDQRAVTTAKAICEGCTVRAECRSFAATEHIVDGIWGGALRTIARERTARGVRRSTKTLTAAERQWMIDQGLIADDDQERAS